MCFVWISEQTAIISLYNINWLVFITETEPLKAQWSLYVPPVYHEAQNQQTVQCEVLTDSGQIVEDSSGHRGTEPKQKYAYC